MASTIRSIIVVLLLLLVIALPVNAQDDPCVGSLEGVQIVLESGSVITGGAQRAVIQIGDTNIPVELAISCSLASVAGAEAGSESPQATATVEASSAGGASSIESTAEAVAGDASQSITGQTVPVAASNQIALVIGGAVAVIILLVMAGGVVYFRILLPRSRKKPLEESEQKLQAAQEALKQGDVQGAESALDELDNQPIDSASRRTARFLKAYTRFKQKEFDDALLILKGLYKDNSADYELAYFLAYIYVQQKQYERAAPILDELEQANQIDFFQTRRLLGIVKLSQATKAFNEGRIDVAAELFETVRALGDFTDQIPSDMRNRQVLLGTRALYEANVKEAREQFESLQEAAELANGDEQKEMKVTAVLGLALTAWIDNRVDYDQIEALLTSAAQLLSPDEPLTGTWPSDVVGRSLGAKLAELDAEERSVGENALSLVLRDIHFLRGINVINRWRSIDSEAALNQSSDMFNQVIERLACALIHDPDFADVLVVFGLLAYYLSQPGTTRRNEGIGSLEEARKLGVRVPEILEILTRIDEIRDANASVVDKYLQVLDKYLSDETVQKEVRQSLLDQLSSFRRIQGLRTRPDLVPVRVIEPSVAEVRDRSDLLRTRVEDLLAARAGDQSMDGVRRLSRELKDDGQRLFEQAKSIQKKEADLLAQTGKYILSE